MVEETIRTIKDTECEADKAMKEADAACAEILEKADASAGRIKEEAEAKAKENAQLLHSWFDQDLTGKKM